MLWPNTLNVHDIEYLLCRSLILLAREDRGGFFLATG